MKRFVIKSDDDESSRYGVNDWDMPLHMVGGHVCGDMCFSILTSRDVNFVSCTGSSLTHWLPNYSLS